MLKHMLEAKLRCLSNEEVVKSIMKGIYNSPIDQDKETKLLLEEHGKMGMQIRNNEGQDILITPEDFIRFWKRMDEFTTSPLSGIKYSHYKASTKYKRSSKIHAQQFTLIARSEVYSKRYNLSLQVLLEKIAEVCLVEKK